MKNPLTFLLISGNSRHMRINPSWQSVEDFFNHSYPGFCIGLISLLVCYFSFNHLTIYSVELPILKWLLTFFIVSIATYIGHKYQYHLLTQDYKIGHELQNICFAILFILLAIMLSAVLQKNFQLVRPYAYFALLILPAIFFYAKRALTTISTGHLFFGTIILALMSAFIPIAISLAFTKLYLVISFEWRFLFKDMHLMLTNYESSLRYLSIGLCLLILYGFTPFYLKERHLHRESKELFAHFACVIQILLLPLYFSLLPESEQIVTISKGERALHYYPVLFLMVTAIIILGIYSVISRKNNWLNNANLLTKDIISPITLAAILIFIKLPNITVSSVDVFLEIIPQYLRQPSYFDAWIIPDMVTNSDLLSYAPLLLAKLLSLLNNTRIYHELVPFSFLFIHTLLVILTFSALSRFLPHLFTFAILFIIPIKFPELLLLISYASLLFDRRLLQSPLKWSALWYFGGCLFLILSPLYALFFLIGIIPYIVFNFIQFYQKNQRHTRNLTLFYIFITIAMIFSPNIQMLAQHIIEFIQSFWLFGDNYVQWGQQLEQGEGKFWERLLHYTAFTLWWLGLMILALLLLLFRKKLLTMTQTHYNLGDWVIISCGLTMVFSFPVALNSLLGFDHGMTLIRLIYMFALFGVPVILFRNTTLFNKSTSYLLCGFTLLGMCIYSYMIVPEFNMIWTLQS